MIDNEHKLTRRKNKRGAAILLLVAIAAISFACLLIDDAPTHSSNEILPYGLDYAPFFPQ